MDKINLLLTGANGFIGKPLLKLIESKNINITVIGRTKPLNFKGSFFKVDIINDTDSKICNILNKIKPTHLIHLAWYTEHGKFWDSEENTLWMIKSVSLIKKFCDSGGKNVIAAGSCAEYSWNSHQKLTESSECKSTSLYGISKSRTRKLITEVCNNSNVSITWCRIFFPYGPKDNANKLIPQLKKVARGLTEPFQIEQPGLRDFLHVEDIAEAFLIIMKTNSIGIINICRGVGHDLNELMQKVLKNNLVNSSYKSNSHNNKNIINIVGDNTILLELGWKPRIDLYSYIIE